MAERGPGAAAGTVALSSEGAAVPGADRRRRQPRARRVLRDELGRACAAFRLPGRAAEDPPPAPHRHRPQRGRARPHGTSAATLGAARRILLARLDRPATTSSRAKAGCASTAGSTRKCSIAFPARRSRPGSASSAAASATTTAPLPPAADGAGGVYRPDSLATASRATGLRLRSNQPASTSSPAWRRHRQRHVPRPRLRPARAAPPTGLWPARVHGLFLLPAAGGDPARTLTLGNAYAALTELNHFATRA